MAKSGNEDLQGLINSLQWAARATPTHGGVSLYSPKPKHKFKVGDRVETIDSDVGIEGVIEECVYFDGSPTYHIRTIENKLYHYSEGAIRKVVVKKEYPIKVNEKELERVTLRPDVKNDILALLSMATKSKTIFKEWGLEETVEYGKGMTALFYGPPGTGKTWTAHCMAKAVGRELMVVSCAQIQSCMAGETAKNIEKAFGEARKNGRVLLLDEADSFIGDRKNLGMIIGAEINTILTEIEKFEGILILTTNQIGHLDPALERRISLIVEFKNPTLEERKAIWQILLPKKLPLHSNVSIDKLAEHKLTGGFIKNVLLHAARLAAAKEEKQVAMEHFETAISRIRESQGKMGTRGMQGVVDYKITGEMH